MNTLRKENYRKFSKADDGDDDPPPKDPPPGEGKGG